MTIKKKIVNFLDRNENQYGPAPACFKVLQKSDDNTLNIYSRDFTRGIKSILSERLAKDFGIEEKRILLGYGSEDILKQAVHCYVGKGDKIMIPSYSWWYYKKIAQEAGGVNIEYPIAEGENSFFYDIEGMMKVYQEQKPKLILISSPNNPTGNRLEIKQLNFVLEKMKDTVVVLDEAYSLFDVTYNCDPADLIKRFPNLIIIRTFSKYFALAGIRTGFAFLGDNHERLSLLSTRYLGYNRLSEKIAIAALDSDDYYTSISKKIVEDIGMLFTELNKLPGFYAYRSYANFILVKIPPVIKDQLNKYLTERNMIIKFINEDGLCSHIRITIGTHSQNCQLLELLESFINEKTKHDLAHRV
jgi:histidinol-phosphate aminotransferase